MLSYKIWGKQFAGKICGNAGVAGGKSVDVRHETLTRGVLLPALDVASAGREAGEVNEMK